MVKPSFAIALALACIIAAANGLKCHKYIDSNGAMQHTKVTCQTQNTKCYIKVDNRRIITEAGCAPPDWSGCRAENKQAACCDGDFCNGNGRTCLKSSWGSVKTENCFNQETRCKSIDPLGLSESAEGCATVEECSSLFDNAQCCTPNDCNNIRKKSFECYDDRGVMGTGEAAPIVTCKATEYDFIEKEVIKGNLCGIGTWNGTTIGMGCTDVKACKHFEDAGHDFLTGCCAKDYCNEGNEHLPKLTIMIMTFFLVYLFY